MSQVSQWFDNLAKVQSRVKELDNQTEDDLYAFSHQKLELIQQEHRRENVCQFCQVRGIGNCRPNTFADVTNTFRWFLDAISNPIDALLAVAAFNIASDSLTPRYVGDLVDLRAKPVRELCATAGNNAILASGLLADVPAGFLAGKGDVVQQAITSGRTVLQLCQEIVK
jgi:hypothetical protein